MNIDLIMNNNMNIIISHKINYLKTKKMKKINLRKNLIIIKNKKITNKIITTKKLLEILLKGLSLQFKMGKKNEIIIIKIIALQRKRKKNLIKRKNSSIYILMNT